MDGKSITTWFPDTCGCIIEYSFDRDSDLTSRIHTFYGHSRKCHDHEHLWNEDIYTTVLEENERKNITLQHAAEHTILGHTVSVGKRGERRMRPDVHHNFFFTHQASETETGPNKPRILHLSFSEQVPDKGIIEARFPGLVKVH